MVVGFTVIQQLRTSSTCSALITWLTYHTQECVDGYGHVVMLVGAPAPCTINDIDRVHGRWSHVVNDDWTLVFDAGLHLLLGWPCTTGDWIQSTAEMDPDPSRSLMLG